MTYKKSTEQTVMFKLVDETNFATPEPGKSPSVEISKDAGAFTATTNSAAEVSDGWYKVTLTSTEMNADEIILKATAAGAAQSDRVVATESITALATDIAGANFDTASQSLSKRPSGASGGAGCAWFDADLKRANKFFKSFPTEFKEFEKQFTNLQRKVSDSELKSTTTSQLSGLADIIEAIQTTMDSMKAEQELTDKIILEMASEKTLEAALNGSE